jgi:amino acid permease
MTKPLVLVAAVLGVVFLGLTVYYFMTPANALPSFFPGYSADVTRHHTTHAIVALVVAVVLFVFAWFQSKPAKA